MRMNEMREREKVEKAAAFELRHNIYVCDIVICFSEYTVLFSSARRFVSASHVRVLVCVKNVYARAIFITFVTGLRFFRWRILSASS